MTETPPALARTFAARTRVPWFNGAGFTTELVSFEDSARHAPDLSPWRLSIAELSRPGSFSAIPGVTRMFCPVGADVVLRIDGATVTVVSHQVLTFDGGAEAELLELPSPCHAVNLMSRDGGAEQAVMRLDEGPPSRAGLAVVRLEGEGRFDVLVPPDDAEAPRLRIERPAREC
ncbi:HutD family protein [Demequina mangrovi]|nr:HutD family protein [Demequina mangrovi]